MYHFHIYLYEGFSLSGEVPDERNPRLLLRAPRADDVLSAVAAAGPDGLGTEDTRRRFGGCVDALLLAGALSERRGRLRFGCPVFLPEDVPELRRLSSAAAEEIASALLTRADELRAAVSGRFPGIDVKTALYHLLCCDVMDGTFIDALEGRGLVSSGAMRPCGFKYIPVLYAWCEELDALSRRLLCSRQSCGGEAGEFVSFGDSDGVRRDFAAARRSGELAAADCGALAREFASLCRGDGADRESMELFERFGYAKNGRADVPVFEPSARHAAVAELTETVLDSALPAAENALRALSGAGLTANRHGADAAETANELFHLIFGAVNGLLCGSGLAASPEYTPGEGRYLRAFCPAYEKGENT